MKQITQLLLSATQDKKYESMNCIIFPLKTSNPHNTILIQVQEQQKEQQEQDKQLLLLLIII